MLSHIRWENQSSGNSGKSFSSKFQIPYLDGNYTFSAFFTDRRDWI